MSDKFGKIIIRTNGTVANPVTVSITNIETGAAIVDGESVTTTMYSKYVHAFAAYEVSVGNLSNIVSIAEGDAKYVGDVFGIVAGITYGIQNSIYGIGTDGVAETSTVSGHSAGDTIISLDFCDVKYRDANDTTIIAKKAGYYGAIDFQRASSSGDVMMAPTFKDVNDTIILGSVAQAQAYAAGYAVMYFGETNPFA